MATKRKIKVKNNPSLVRDSFSKAIINIDRNTYAQHRLRKKSLLDKDQKIQSLEDAVDQLQKEHAKLVALVQSITKKS